MMCARMASDLSVARVMMAPDLSFARAMMASDLGVARAMMALHVWTHAMACSSSHVSTSKATTHVATESISHILTLTLSPDVPVFVTLSLVLALIRSTNTPLLVHTDAALFIHVCFVL